MAKTAAYLSFVRPINLDTANALLSAFNKAIEAGATDITLLMSSPGGHLMSGFAVYNQLLGLPIDLTTYNIGSMNSIANIIFLAGEVRLAALSATFLFHGSACTYPANAEATRRQIAETLESLNADEKRMRDIIVSRTRLSRQKIDKMMDAGVTKDAAFAKDVGIVHEIRDVTIPSGGQIVQI